MKKIYIQRESSAGASAIKGFDYLTKSISDIVEAKVTQDEFAVELESKTREEMATILSNLSSAIELALRSFNAVEFAMIKIHGEAFPSIKLVDDINNIPEEKKIPLDRNLQ